MNTASKNDIKTQKKRTSDQPSKPMFSTWLESRTHGRLIMISHDNTVMRDGTIPSVGQKDGKEAVI